MANHKLFFLFTFLFFVTNTYNCHAQDTIYITEKPVVVKKKVIITKELPASPKKTFLYYAFQTGLSLNRDYYGTCASPICMDYYLQVRASTKPLYNNIVSFSVGYISNRVVMEPSLFYSLYRERFTYQEPALNKKDHENYYHQIDFSLKPGYYYDTKKSRFYLLIKVGPSLSYLLNVSGQTYKKDNPYYVSELSKEIKFNSLIYRLGIDFSLGRKVYNRLSFVSTIFYSYDLLSTINKSDYFTRQRNILGIKIGLVYLKRTGYF